MNPAGPFDWLLSWYGGQCDGAWEHGYGVTIGTIDNPGWSLTVDLTGTPLAGCTLEHISHNYEDGADWWVCWAEDDKFQAAGGPHQLGNMIMAFREWTEGRLSRDPIA